MKINREYLDPALLALNQHNNALVEKYKAQQHAVHSASQAVADRQQSKLILSRNLSRGAMIAIVLVGFGIMVSLMAWSLPRLVGQLRNPVMTVEPNSSPADIITGSSSGVESETSTDIVTNPPPPALIVPAYSREQGSKGCITSESFRSPCAESVVLENGAIYNGTWRNGAANGEGEITFLDDGSIRGTWQDGALIEILEVNTPVASPTIKSSVTVFAEKSAPDAAGFSDVVVGHNFSTPNDQTWANAFCYVYVFDGDESFRVDLSSIDDFNAKIRLKSYNSSMRVSREDFESAQKLCPYKYTNF